MLKTEKKQARNGKRVYTLLCFEQKTEKKVPFYCLPWSIKILEESYSPWPINILEENLLLIFFARF